MTKPIPHLCPGWSSRLERIEPRDDTGGPFGQNLDGEIRTIVEGGEDARPGLERELRAAGFQPFYRQWSKWFRHEEVIPHPRGNHTQTPGLR